MKTIKILALVILTSLGVQAQQDRSLDNFREPDQRGINVFEDPKSETSTFNGVKVRIGGASTLQYQALDHQNDGVVPLIPINNNFNLATANLDLDVALYHGVRMHLRTYLSSRHHPEPYVKGGYILIDRLDFIKENFASNLMKYMTFKLGHMEINYGDAHFRRSDNAQAIHNPFVGTYILDDFTTEVGLEAYYRRNGFMVMGGVTNGRLNQTVNAPLPGARSATSPSVLAKIGYDKQLNSDLRVRLTGSLYNSAHSTRTFLFGGDRAGSRYYFVLEPVGATSAGNFNSGLLNPGLTNKLTAVMINPFIKYKGFEFFGMYESLSGRTFAETERRNWTQLSSELIYRFGKNEKFYVASRYTQVNGTLAASSLAPITDIDANRFQLSAGWFLTKNILTKVEYVNQKYKDFPNGNILRDGQFNGFVAEAVISF